MTDRKNVIRGLVCCIGNHLCFSCVYYDPDNVRCQKDLMRDALALLKEQEPVKPIRLENWWKCSSCNGNIVANMNYCPKCGKPVEWND